MNSIQLFLLFWFAGRTSNQQTVIRSCIFLSFIFFLYVLGFFGLDMRRYWFSGGFWKSILYCFFSHLLFPRSVQKRTPGIAQVMAISSLSLVVQSYTISFYSLACRILLVLSYTSPDTLSSGGCCYNAGLYLDRYRHSYHSYRF